jgi:hypothetical protein
MPLAAYFPNDFDLGYADSDVITLKKSFITLATGAELTKLFFETYESAQ